MDDDVLEENSCVFKIFTLKLPTSYNELEQKCKLSVIR